VALCGVALAGCVESAINFSERQPDDPDAAGETDDGDATDEPYLGPHFFALNAEIEVVSGAIDPEESSLTLTWYNAQATPYGTKSSCAPSLEDAAPGPTTELASELFGFWQLSVVAADDDPCPWSLPSPAAAGDAEVPQLVLGVGPLDPRLGPALDAAEAEPDASVYGLYTLLPGPEGDRLLTFGAAGTQGNWDGSDLAVEAPPLPDGRYELRTLVLLPVPEAGR
jgi:hypothetical protein